MTCPLECAEQPCAPNLRCCLRGASPRDAALEKAALALAKHEDLLHEKGLPEIAGLASTVHQCVVAVMGRYITEDGRLVDPDHLPDGSRTD